NIGLAEEGDIIKINIPKRTISMDVSDETIAKRRATMEAKGKGAWTPDRDRVVSAALRAYAAMTTSADKGAVRYIP
ncbi:MAG: dihydroxy-acid dehydratase, partial [Reichenbachiella sp.]